MRICFSGFSNPICINTSSVAVLEIHNKTLFTRVCASLFSEKGVDSLEPYSLWEDSGDCIANSCQLLLVGNPLELPWNHKNLHGAVIAKLEKLLKEQDEYAELVESHFRLLSKDIATLALQFQGDYAFDIEWEIKRYLKAFGFKAEVDDSDSLIDNLIRFLNFVKDARFMRPIVFINLKTFLTKNEITQLYRQAFFLEISLFLIENIPDESSYSHEVKYIIDQDLLEEWPSL